MRTTGNSGSLDSSMAGAYHQRAIELIVFTPGVDGITQQHHEQQNNGEKGSIVERQAQTDRHDLSLLFAQHIASATDRVDQSRFSLSFELLTKLHHIDFHHI